MNQLTTLALCLFLAAILPGCSTVLQTGPSDAEIQSNPAWIKTSANARFVYWPEHDFTYGEAQWNVLNSNYRYDESAGRSTLLRVANGPGQLVFRKKPLRFGNVFDAQNTIIEVKGDWKDGHLVSLHSKRTADDIHFNWDAIGVGMGIGLAPLAGAAWVGNEMKEAIKDGARLSLEEEDRAKNTNAYKCPRCGGYGRIDPTNSSQTFAERAFQGFVTCPRCDGTGWLRNGQPYKP
jgi:hypothetical protein